MSIRIRSGCSAGAIAIATSASVALSTLCPADSRRKTASVMLAGLSSTTSTLVISGHHLAPRHGAPDLRLEAAAGEVALLHDRRDVAVQARAVARGDRLGRDDEDGNASRVGVEVERLDDVEAAHFRHHQI